MKEHWSNIKDYISERIQADLPGPNAQFQMAPAFRKRPYQIPYDTKQAAVLILLYPKRISATKEQLHTVFIQRVSSSGHDRHRGQISLPGGTLEDQDQSLIDTAVRETFEEIGTPRESVEILGSLTDLYIPVSGFHVHPFVGFTDQFQDFKIQESEVEHVIETPVDFLTRDEIRKTKKIKMSNGRFLREVPYFDLDGQVLWGATAMIISEFLALLAAK